MPSCLGLYIEDNLIKYAKVSQNSQITKIEAFGVKFYENISTAIKQIVEETYSFKVPISINTTEEWYNDVNIFSLLSKKDIEHAVKTEFENICYEKEINKNIYEERYIFTNGSISNDKIKVIHVSVPKTSIEQRKNQFSEYKISSIVPLSISIASLNKKERKGTDIIVNIEKNTTITKITNGVVADVKVIDLGSQEILDKINQKENSYAKAYEICKNTTIYTETDRDLQYEENEYLEDIMPTLFQIATQVKNYVNESMERIDKVYITGTGAVINNIDIYFQNHLRNEQCEILRPAFVNNNSKVNIKDHIEVNSAISIALLGLDKNNKVINFKKESNVDKIMTALNSNVNDLSELEITKSVKDFFEKFSNTFNVISITSVLVLVAYFAGILAIEKQIDNKIAQADISISETNRKIDEIKEHNSKFNSQITTYQNLIRSIEELNNTSSEDRRYKNTIPNLLNNIMVVIPKNVQLISIENSTDTHVKIKAKSQMFQQIAYFKTKLDTEGILKNVVSDTGTTKEGYLTVTIEGELP